MLAKNTYWCWWASAIFFPIYIKLPRRSSNSYHSQEAPVIWPKQALYSLTHSPLHVAFVFCWLCLFLWLTAGYTVTQSHILILCSFCFNNQPVSILHTCCIHFLPQQNTDFYLTLPCRVPHLLCGMSQLQVPTPKKPTLTLKNHTPCAWLLHHFIPLSSLDPSFYSHYRSYILKAIFALLFLHTDNIFTPKN